MAEGREMDFNPWEGLARIALGPRHVEMEGLVGSEDYRNRGPRTGIQKRGKGKGSETGGTLVASVGNMELAQGDVIRKSVPSCCCGRGVFNCIS